MARELLFFNSITTLFSIKHMINKLGSRNIFIHQTSYICITRDIVYDILIRFTSLEV